jgi:hypothetical protein
MKRREKSSRFFWLSMMMIFYTELNDTKAVSSRRRISMEIVMKNARCCENFLFYRNWKNSLQLFPVDFNEMLWQKFYIKKLFLMKIHRFAMMKNVKLNMKIPKSWIEKRVFWVGGKMLDCDGFQIKLLADKSWKFNL